ncbi:MAG: DUF6476 family protein, partial [Gemmobacter sp.]
MARTGEDEDSPRLPRGLRLLQGLVVVLTLSMIGGIVAVVAVIGVSSSSGPARRRGTRGRWRRCCGSGSGRTTTRGSCVGPEEPQGHLLVADLAQVLA